MTQHTFSIKSVLLFGWEETKKHYWFLLQAGFIAALVMGGTVHTGPLTFISMLVVALGVIAIALSMTYGKEPSFKTALLPFEDPSVMGRALLSTIIYIILGGILVSIMAAAGNVLGLAVFSNLFTPDKVLMVRILTTIVLVLGLLAIIYISIRLKFYLYAIVDKEARTLESFKYSNAITQGHFWKLLGLNLILAVINIIGALPLGLGLFITIPFTVLAYTKTYRVLSGN